MNLQFKNNAPNSSPHSSLYIRTENPDPSKVENAKRIILEEYKKYPNVIKKSGLKIVNLVSNLRVKNNKDIDKFVKNSESPDPESKWMYVDVDYLENKEYFRQCINHEIAHHWEFGMSGSFNPEDLEWSSLNPKNFKYRRGGWEAYHSDFENKFHSQKGFITSYSTLSMDEDKAELFMYLFTDHLKDILLNVLAEDNILKAKLSLLKKRIHKTS